MSNVKELKDRIGAVRDTRQITNAMFLVASTKLRHAKEDLERTRPYFDALRREMFRLFRADSGLVNRYFYDEDGTLPDNGVSGILVITGDKGLAGAYNLNVLRKAEALTKENPGARLFVIGEYGRRWFQTRRIPIEPEFRYSAQIPNQDDSRDICTRLLELYQRSELDEILVVYTDMQSSVSSAVRVDRLLPLARSRLAAAERDPFSAAEIEYEYFPSQEAVLEAVMRSYLSGFIYSAVVDSLCAEQNARVTSMESANRNAEELIAALSLQLNRERQSAITQEITEISAGAQAQRRGRKEEA
ncbi:MAG: ATP synthase F1 subunit gamma [Oscillospiraceae bacterium]|nr:ATP synthase F1 subunit gamma [Oscillospiraceae bacterium]